MKAFEREMLVRILPTTVLFCEINSIPELLSKVLFTQTILVGVTLMIKLKPGTLYTCAAISIAEDV